MKKKFIQIDDTKLRAISCIQWLSLSYATRGFYIEIYKNKIYSEKWNECYFKIFKMIVKKYIKEYIEIDGIYMSIDDAIDKKIYKLHRKYSPYTREHINEIIVLYNNSLSTNPEYTFKKIFEINSEFSMHVIEKLKEEVHFLHSICIKYGFYPGDLMSHKSAIDVYEHLERKNIYLIDTFLERVWKLHYGIINRRRS